MHGTGQVAVNIIIPGQHEHFTHLRTISLMTALMEQRLKSMRTVPYQEHLTGDPECTEHMKMKQGVTRERFITRITGARGLAVLQTIGNRTQ